eukprot:364743-Chlamydomonas_euryale.AAC.110
MSCTGGSQTCACKGRRARAAWSTGAWELHPGLMVLAGWGQGSSRPECVAPPVWTHTLKPGPPQKELG